MKKVLSLVVVMLFTVFSYAQSADDIVGVWYTEGGKSKVEITKKGSKYYGKIIWLKFPNNDQGTPKVDKNNEDDKLKTKPIIGLEILNGFEWDEDIYEGTIYDPENGNVYSCEVTYENKDTLNVRGYVGFSLLGRTTIWTRVK